MAVPKSFLICFGFVLFSTIKFSEGLWCFQCNSLYDIDCLDIQPNETSSVHYKECVDNHTPNEPFCRKISQKIHDRDGLIRVIRKCGWVKHKSLDCYTVRNHAHSETTCQCFTDACNSALGHKESGMFILLSAFILLLVPLINL